jgi:hypothetical protein
MALNCHVLVDSLNGSNAYNTSLTLFAFGSLLLLDLAADFLAIVTVRVVTGGLWLFGATVTVALLSAGIATATDPAATMDVVKESSAQGE